MDNSDFSNVRYAMSDGWTKVRPLGEPVTIHADRPYADTFVSAMHESAFERTLELEHFNKEFPDGVTKEFLDELTHIRSVCDLFYKSNVRRMTYPATVRQAKSRHKGNRDNEKRRYEYVVVQCMMHDVRIKNETA